MFKHEMARRLARTNWAAVALTLILALVCGGCGNSSSSTDTASGKASFYTGGTPGGKPVRGGTATIELTEAPPSLDPIGATTTTAADVSMQVSEGLVETVSGSKEVKPDLATSWTISPDGLTYTFHIREGIKFSNGEPLTGEDVVYSIERETLPTAGDGAFIAPEIKKLSLVNPMTVRIQLKHVTASFLSIFAWVATGIVPKHVVQHESEKVFALHPIGTGAFMLKSASPGFTNIVMVRNPYYWRKGQPYLNELSWNLVGESNARILAVRSGTATIDLNVPYSQASALQSSASGDRLLIEPLLSLSSGAFNNLVAPFSNLDVRKALNYATPRAAIIKAAFKGLGSPANSLMSNLMKYYNPNVPVFPYDISKAKALLKDSPYSHGFNMSLLIYSGEPTSTLIASILQSTWAQIGVHLSIRPLDPTTFITDQYKGAYQMLLWTPELLASELYEPDLGAEIFYGRNAVFKINSPRADALIEKATSTLNNARRATLFGELQRVVNWEEARYLPIAFLPQVSLVSGALRGFTYPPTSLFRMREAWLTH